MALLPVNRLITRPRTVLPPALMFNALFELLTGRLSPRSSTIAHGVAAHGAPVYAGAVNSVAPSITTGTLMFGSAESGAIENGPAPGMLNVMLFVDPVFRFESLMAWRSDPAPLSLVVVTTNVIDWAATLVV